MFDIIGAAGRLAILIGFLATCIASFSYFLSLKNLSFIRFARIGFHITTTAVFIASAALLVLILKHQFQFHYVWAYSSRDLPLGLLMSTFYAGQEGSFLLWTLMVVVIGVFLLSYTQKHKNEREVMGIYLAILGFLMLLLVVKNPFALIEGGAIPVDGRGLNPLLQNFWMQIHPPILFLGFAAMAPPFAFAIAALMQRQYRQWVTSALPWILTGSLTLGLGIALGGFWAYETLGWGGWWGWDPVENSSLIPWLVSIALLHTMLTQKRTQGLIMTNFILAMLGFVTVLYSTFLTRSGVLGDASVHSFVDPGRFAFTLLVLFMFVFIDTGFALLFIRFTKWGNRISSKHSGWKLLAVVYLYAIVPSIPIFAKVAGDIVPVFTDLITESDAAVSLIFYPFLGLAHFLNMMSYLWLPALIFKIWFLGYVLTGRMHSEKDFRSFVILSRETVLGLGAVIIGILTFFILIGTSLPIIPKSLTGAVNSIFEWINNIVGADLALGNTVEPSFYNAIGLPLAILIGLVTGLALLLKWKNDRVKDLIKKSLFPLSLSLVFSILLLFAGNVTDPGMLLLGFAAVFSFIINAQVGYKVMRGNPRFTGAYITHLGIALLLLGIIGSGFYSQKRALELPQGIPVEAFGYKLTYTGNEPFWKGERYYFNVKLTDLDDREIETVKTIMFFSHYGGQEQLMRNPGIAKFLTEDIYLEPQTLYQPDPAGYDHTRLTKGQTYEFSGYFVTFIGFQKHDIASQGEPFSIGSIFRVDKNGKTTEELIAKQTTDPEGVKLSPARTEAGDLEIEVLRLLPNMDDPSQSAVEVRLRNPQQSIKTDELRETLVLEASLKPFISLVWIGILISLAGFVVANFRRIKEAKRVEITEDLQISSRNPTEDVSVNSKRIKEIETA